MQDEIKVEKNVRVLHLSRDDWAAQGKIFRKGDPEYKYVHNNWELYPFRGASGYALEVHGKFVSFVATGFNKYTRPDGWGPYANNYLAYTPPQYRGNGYVIQLNAAVERAALREGWKRSTSLAAGWTGFLYQLKAGRTFWGLTLNDELCTDTPLDPNNPQQGLGVPYNVRKCLQPHPLSEDELIQILSSSAKYGNQPRKDLERLFYKHPLAYDPTTWKRRALF